ncbi:hypothetical protein BGZ95_005849 [Linnemannia exigua]|uniref:Translational machinery component n=1 Tax=Linnemannia exigua TaxID=604196 RepID=A0AAD4H0Y4_9FUNG|nr:hypothetical protein BGZ95_005849 [Linnemannia exigua]
MLSVTRQALRATIPCVRPVQSFRLYTTDDSNNNSNSGSRKVEGTEALMNILSGSSSSQQPARANTNNSNTTKGSSAALIMETLSKATDRQQQASRSPSFLSSKNLMGNSGAGGFSRFLSDTQTCSHNLHIHASMNNTILTLTDSQGDPITTQSAGSAGFKKSARSGPEAGYQAMIKLVEKVQEKNVQIHSLHVLMKGFGPGRDSAFKAIRAKTEWDIKRISDTTPIPFNGCRPPKARRL